MSRYHAKIVFTETGSVHLIDLKSHHGTYILKQGDLTSVRLCPDLPVPLAHGDTVTFGKSVGRDKSIVRPVTVIVRLLYGSAPPPPLPVAHAVASSWGPATLKSPKPSSSGRYGIYDALPDSPSSQQGESSSSSSSSDESTSSRDSDVEEIEPPEEYPIQRSEVTRGFEGSHLPPIRGLGLLGRLFPSVHAPQPTNVSSSPILSRQGSKHLWFYDDDEDDITSNASTGQVTSHSIVGGPEDENMANFLDILNGVRTPEPFLASTNMPPVDPPVIGAYPLSRIASPAPPHAPEMTIPSPVPEPVALEPSQTTPAPRTASPASDSDMDESSSQSDDDTQDSLLQRGSNVNHTIVVEGNGEEQSMVIEEAPGLLDSHILAPQISATRTDLDNGSMDVVPTSTDTTAPNPANGKLASFEESLVNLRASVLRVNIAHRKTQADQKAQSDRAAALDKRIDETNAQYETLCDRIDGAYASCDELRGELANLGDGLKSFEERHLQKVTDVALSQVEQALAQRPPAPTYEMLENALISRRDVRSSVQTLRNLVAELQTLKETTSKEVADELELLRAARAQAATAAITIANQSAAVPSLKRKRSDVDDADADDAVAEHHAGVVREGPPRAKRSRRVLRAAVHTAAAVTVGAVAAWSALAFA
ncbi:hypothetical protein DENSPDRAFT_836619 [Dentipellis sp. KUC8613]|nr:hypothetical protein DENSPDRAFT_836619 [Dentipellis sp. KUC8613]